MTDSTPNRPSHPPGDRPVMGDHPELEPDAVPPAPAIVEGRNPVSWTLMAAIIAVVLLVGLVVLLLI